MKQNVILKTDAYKLTHWKQYPNNITKLYSYGEPRNGGKYPFLSFFGLSMIIQDHFLESIDNEMIDEAEEESVSAFGTNKYFNREVWKKVRDLGYFPIKIKSVPEGTKLPQGNVAFTIESTASWFATTVNALEDLLMHSWYPTGVATRAMYIKEAIKPYFDKTSEIADLVLPYAVNDFGYRGATSDQSAERAGAAFLTHFIGSDNLPGSRAIKNYYGTKGRLKSVWATEHSVATSYGLSLENEKEYLLAQLEHADPKLIVSVVIDSKDSDNFIQNVVADPIIKEKIKAREGRVVFRPDSGDPKTNIIKYLDILGGIFGYRINSCSGGYKVLNDNVGLIQGDGMDEVSIPELYKEVTKVGWSAENFVTGSGGGLLQVDLSRDVSRWAVKASYGERLSNDLGIESFNIQKDPKTDPSKKSKTGMLKLHPSMRHLSTISSADHINFNSFIDALETVYENGVFTKQSFESILNNVNAKV